MSVLNLTYKIKTAGKKEIFSHLKECNQNFIPPLDEKVNIQTYSRKLFEKSLTFEAWANQTLVGLVAAYFNNIENNYVYITNVSILNKYRGKGIASELINLCINYAKEHNFKRIILEVFKSHNEAIYLYKKIGFLDFENKDDFLVMKLEINSI